MSQVHTYPTMPPTRCGHLPAETMAVLISVPKVRSSAVEPTPSMRGRAEWRRPSVRRDRPRRLRRGVRIAAWSLVSMVPLLGGSALAWANLASRALILPSWAESARTDPMARQIETVSIESIRPADSSIGVSIDIPSLSAETLSPVIGQPVADMEVPVIFPGYVLPDDSMEERAHAGS
jgi:hypothetical protein